MHAPGHRQKRVLISWPLFLGSETRHAIYRFGGILGTVVAQWSLGVVVAGYAANKGSRHFRDQVLLRQIVEKATRGDVQGETQ